MRVSHARTGHCTAGSIPKKECRVVGADGDHGQIEGTKSLANLLEHRAVASVSSKPDALSWPLDAVASPQCVSPVAQTSGAPVLHTAMPVWGPELLCLTWNIRFLSRSIAHDGADKGQLIQHHKQHLPCLTSRQNHVAQECIDDMETLWTWESMM